MAGYKALMSMALNGRHELLSLLLQTGITTAQHALLLLESVIQKKGRLSSIERVVAEMLRYIGPCNEEAGSVLIHRATGLQINDVDVGAGMLTVSLNASHGLLTLGHHAGLSFLEGSTNGGSIIVMLTTS